MIKRGLWEGAQVQVALGITLFTGTFQGATEVEEIMQSPPVLLVLFLALMSRISNMTLTRF